MVMFKEPWSVYPKKPMHPFLKMVVIPFAIVSIILVAFNYISGQVPNSDTKIDSPDVNDRVRLKGQFMGCPRTDAFFRHYELQKENDDLAASRYALSVGCAAYSPAFIGVVTKVDRPLFGCVRGRGEYECVWFALDALEKLPAGATREKAIDRK